MTAEELKKNGFKYTWDFNDQEITCMMATDIVLHTVPNLGWTSDYALDFRPKKMEYAYIIFKHPTENWIVYYFPGERSSEPEDIMIFDKAYEAFYHYLSCLAFKDTSEKTLNIYKEIVAKGFSKEAIDDYYKDYFETIKRIYELENAGEYDDALMYYSARFDERITKLRTLRNGEQYDRR